MLDKKWLKIAIVELLAIILLITTHKETILIIKGVLFLQILLYASLVDIEIQKIPNRVHVLILLISFIQFNFVSSLLGCFIAIFINVMPRLFGLRSLGLGETNDCKWLFFRGNRIYNFNFYKFHHVHSI